MTRFLTLGLLTAVCGAARADVESGPKAGEKPAELKVFAATGPSEGKAVEYVAERKGAATVYLFVRADRWSRPMARFVRELDGKLPDGAAAVAVWVGGDPAADKEYLPKAQQSLKLANTALTAFEGGGDGPAGWAVNPDAHLTAVVVRGGKVVRSFAYESVNETDAPAVAAAVKGDKR